MNLYLYQASGDSVTWGSEGILVSYLKNTGVCQKSNDIT